MKLDEFNLSDRLTEKPAKEMSPEELRKERIRKDIEDIKRMNEETDRISRRAEIIAIAAVIIVLLCRVSVAMLCRL